MEVSQLGEKQIHGNSYRLNTAEISIPAHQETLLVTAIVTDMNTAEISIPVLFSSYVHSLGSSGDSFGHGNSYRLNTAEISIPVLFSSYVHSLGSSGDSFGHGNSYRLNTAEISIPVLFSSYVHSLGSSGDSLVTAIVTD
ncbi:hypothetical protein J6590_054430 [Homalodisca vitripennis]|nr:hypothetical protein J6590_054430 [Homalodisca vitripennis]